MLFLKNGRFRVCVLCLLAAKLRVPNFPIALCVVLFQFSLEKNLNLEGFIEKSLKINSALKSTGKSLKSLEKSLNSTIFCRTKHCR